VSVVGKFRVILAIVGCVGLFVAAVPGREPWVGIEPCPDDPSQPLVIAHCFATPPILYLVSMVSVPLLGLAALVALAATAITSYKIAAATAAAALSAFLGLTVFQTAVAQALGIGWMLPESAAISVGPTSFAFGVLVSWVSLKWWPNKSLERTREG
jgi:hypothetical protein